MDTSNLIFTGVISRPTPLSDSGKIDHIPDEKKEQAAKEFESVLIQKLLDGMSRTVGEWGFSKDGVSEQINSIFNLYLARDIGESGGLGLWKDICRYLGGSDQTIPPSESVDKSV